MGVHDTSGCLFLGSNKLLSRSLGSRKRGIMCLCTLAALMLLFSPIRSEAAEADLSGGEAIGTLVDESGDVQSDEGTEVPETVSETPVPVEEEEAVDTVSDGGGAGGSVSSSDVLDVSGSDVSGSDVSGSDVSGSNVPSVSVDVSGSNLLFSLEDTFGKYYPMYDSYDEFMESPLLVTRYENEVLNKLEFIQYALAINIALLFLLIFKKK